MGERYLIVGGGHQGLAMAAHLSLSGEHVKLWNRNREHIQDLINTKEVCCRGILEGKGRLEKVSTDIGDVYENIIFVTVPANAYPDVAKLLAPYVSSDTVIILNPGRTFGALDFMNHLQRSGCKNKPCIAETQTILYTCRRDSRNGCVIHALKKDVLISALRNQDMPVILGKLPLCMRSYFKPVVHMAITSLGNVGMVLHCAPVLMNIGWIENEKVDFKYYYEGISETIARFIEGIDRERILLAKKLGVSVESTADWMKRTYQIQGNSLYECIRNNTYYKEIDAPGTIYHRYLLEDVPCGLVPVESLGCYLHVPTPNITLIIDLACAVLQTDLREKGRRITRADFKMLTRNLQTED